MKRKGIKTIAELCIVDAISTITTDNGNNFLFRLTNIHDKTNSETVKPCRIMDMFNM